MSHKLVSQQRHSFWPRRKYEGKSLTNRNFIITFLQEYLQKLFVSYFSTQSPRFATHSVQLSTSLRAPSRKKLFGVAFNQLCTADITSSSLQTCGPANVLSYVETSESQTTVSILNLHSSVDFRRFHTLWPQKTNKTSLLFHGASWQRSGHTVWAIVQAHTARSSRRLYGMLLRSHFVSRNKIFHCAYFSMHFRIKFLLFNDFPSYMLWSGELWLCPPVSSFRLFGEISVPPPPRAVPPRISTGRLFIHDY